MFLRIINIRLYDSLCERHLVLVTARPFAERAYLVSVQVSPVTRNSYTEIAYTTKCHHLVIEEKECKDELKYFCSNINNCKKR